LRPVVFVEADEPPVVREMLLLVIPELPTPDSPTCSVVAPPPHAPTTATTARTVGIET
jgi:hypothetical protein